VISYQTTFEERPAYLHARVVGERTEDNARRFLVEACHACVEHGRSNLLLEVQFFGPRLDPACIFRVVSERSPDGAKLGRIAYVETGALDIAAARFAETVAANRGVNVCLFPTVAAAARWLAEE